MPWAASWPAVHTFQTETEALTMWIETIAAGRAAHIELVCDGCGATFESDREHAHTRDAVWHGANIAGWVRTAAVPDRHACTTC
jgi:hypothetical protein